MALSVSACTLDWFYSAIRNLVHRSLLINAVEVHAFVDTTEWGEMRTLDQLPSFLERFSGNGGSNTLRNASEENGSPHTLVVAAAGIRAADLTR